MKYTPEQRYELEEKFVIKLANFEGWLLPPGDIHTSQDPRVQQCLQLSQKLIDAVEKAIALPKVSDDLLPTLGEMLQPPQNLNN